MGKIEEILKKAEETFQLLDHKKIHMTGSTTIMLVAIYYQNQAIIELLKNNKQS